MYAGFYYPMKVVYSNAVSWGTLPISVTLPDGTAISDDFEGYVYSFDDDLTQSDCTIPDPSNYTITGLITTTTEPWTGTLTSTSTEMTTVTGTNGQPTDETVYCCQSSNHCHLIQFCHHLLQNKSPALSRLSIQLLLHSIAAMELL
ncbi:YHR213W-like protein [Saccharomyces cerevisiae FostersO]|nr:YHR213W-like protein [Saccharomyces cerevisiae FostersO]